MTASGKWIDFYISHSADGDPSPNGYLRAFESKRRPPSEDWFTLMGAYDATHSSLLPLGSARTASASQLPRANSRASRMTSKNPTGTTGATSR
jgi:hypothetical protein